MLSLLLLLLSIRFNKCDYKSVAVGDLSMISCVTSRLVKRPHGGAGPCTFFFFFFFFFCVPQLYLWGSPLLGEIFAYVTVFFNPTIKVVTFRLRGWCVLGVFLLPAFTRLGHERQDLLSPCDEVHVCTD